MTMKFCRWSVSLIFRIPQEGCGLGLMKIVLTKVWGEERCEVIVSDGLMMIDKVSWSCMNGGYYCIGCRGCGVMNSEYVDVTGGKE